MGTIRLKASSRPLELPMGMIPPEKNLRHGNEHDGKIRHSLALDKSYNNNGQRSRRKTHQLRKSKNHYHLPGVQCDSHKQPHNQGSKHTDDCAER